MRMHMFIDSRKILPEYTDNFGMKVDFRKNNNT